MCDILFIPSEVEYTHFGEMCTESQRKNVYPLAFLFARFVV
jgi:hypothetical protein|nr:MAG TPA: hypothetical protein [Caudoviricetes sp.]DAV73150.1 MAG TPA: hypothetical protein [Caudoviricetes sp.]